jgi:2-dehydropantoate 2-reductase
MVGPATFVVPLQNGVEAASQLAAVLGPEHVLGGLCGTFSLVAAPRQDPQYQHRYLY